MDWRKLARVEKEPALSIPQMIALAGGVALAAQPAIRLLSQKLRRTRADAAHLEHSIDKALKDTFPASDAPASHYYDIPVNRRD